MPRFSFARTGRQDGSCHPAFCDHAAVQCFQRGIFKHVFRAASRLRSNQMKALTVAGFGLLMQLLLGNVLASKAAGQEVEQARLSAPEVQKYELSELYKPSVLPDRVVLTWSDDPCTTQSVTWRTSAAVVIGLAQLTLADSGPNPAKSASRFAAKTTPLTTDSNTAHFHKVTFTDLTPGTQYVYRVGDGTNWSEWYQFSTASNQPSDFHFVYFGDAQNDLRSQWSRVVRQAFRDAPKASFILHAGDLVNTAEMDSEWGEWFSAGAWLNAMIPVVAIPGNHEQAKLPDGSRRLSHHWRNTFAFPENGPEGLEETCYSFTYQNMRMLCLNSNERLEEQAVWLEKVLAANDSQWIICSFHHPVFSTGKGRDNPQLRALWQPIFDKYRVDLVLQGHDHTYGRTGLFTPLELVEADELVLPDDADSPRNLPTGAKAVELSAGTVYVVSVSGPKMYNNSQHWFMRRLAEDTQLYQVIEISESRLSFEARTATGKLYDRFELLKRPGQINRMVEYPPEMPERRRKE